MARKIPEINAASMADIAFLLLIFFLLTTTMDIDTGLLRQLPPWIEDTTKAPEFNRRNVCMVLINRNNDLLVNGEPTDVKDLKDKVKEFILNPTNDENLSVREPLSQKLAEAEAGSKEYRNTKAAYDLLGEQYISKGLVSLQNDRSTLYSVYIDVQDRLVAAFNEMRDDLAKSKFQKPFDQCTEEQRDAISRVLPLAISEANPRNVN